jgi:ABC-2 type transport system permease protein
VNATVAPLAPAPVHEVRRGVRRWLWAYRMMLRWELISLRLFLPVTIVVLVLVGAGFAVGIGLFRDLPVDDARYLATGSAVMTLALVGLILGPQLVAQQKAADTYDFLWSLPVPRTSAAAAWTTVTAIAGLPGMVAAVTVAAWRYDLTFELGWQVVPAVATVIVTSSLVGYALAHAVGNPMVTQAATQVLIFVLIGFSPINFPAERLPEWLQSIHVVLPLEPMGIVMRDALVPDLAADVGRAYVVLAAWVAVVVAINIRVLGRRG